MATATLTPDTCWDDQAFCAFWDAADGFLFDSGWGSTIGSIDDGWALISLLDSFHNGTTPEAAVQEVIDGWEPSDAQMMSAFGTKWHDGL